MATKFCKYRLIIEPTVVQLALYQPDIPHNLGSIIRLTACLNIKMHIIEPCGFPLNDKRIRRAAMDYYEYANITRHISWPAFMQWRSANSRLLLFTTKTTTCYTDIEYHPNDILLFGRESAGVPQNVHDNADMRLLIPINPNCRSLNLSLSAAIAVGEALRQLNDFPALIS